MNRRCLSVLGALALLLSSSVLAAPAPAATPATTAAPAVTTADDLMKLGLDALYVKHAFDEAAAVFRKVLALEPTHYGATFQLASALENAGKRDEARPYWESALKMAEASGDPATAELVRANLPGYPVVVITTDAGVIKVRLNHPRAPLTVDNFQSYVNDKFFDHTIFHRVIDGFMIQGGGLTQDGTAKPTRPPVKSEASNGLKNLRGTIAMARTNDPDSAEAQFFINVVDNGFLDFAGAGSPGYTVFGEVIDGMDVVDRIKVAPKNAQGSPLKPAVIESIRLLP